jgi:hypothetical protein
MHTEVPSRHAKMIDAVVWRHAVAKMGFRPSYFETDVVDGAHVKNRVVHRPKISPISSRNRAL